MSQENEPQVSPEAVKDFLGKKKPEKLIQLTPDQREVVERAYGTPKKEEKEESKDIRYKTGHDKVYDNNPQSSDGILASMLAAFERMEGTAVTEEERALYLRSILRDEAVFLEVQVESLGISIRFKSRSNYENDIIYASIAKDQAEGAIAGIPEYLSRASRYTACVSLDRFGDLPFPRPDFTDTTIPLHKRVDELRDVFKKHMLSMSASKWGLVEVAGRMFERKLALCHDNILNRDFWNPAGAG